ncbi:DNA polymerase [Bacillus phage Karezi]|uniref:DNA polymerase n=1 Tax=Bacillus phage Karezi TaxID=2591398 RepID=A0A514AAN4_9CAUD|nr:DNA polymerase [Bacillus phage Karezi]QDH50332.1 DNA polymerase [Bacillus phage Karezi]
MSRNRPVYVADFEATTDPNDCRVWAWGVMDIYNQENWTYDHDIQSFINWLSSSNCEMYFHNLKYDGSFIVNWLLHNGFTHVEDEPKQKFQFSTVISGMGQWYVIEINFGWVNRKKSIVKIYDSLKKLPFKVSQIAKGFKLDQLKGDIDYHKPRPIGYVMDKEELDYLYNDLKIVADALVIQFEQGLDKMTNGSDALAGFKDIIGKKGYEKLFPVYDLELNEQVRMAYRGGFTWVNPKFQGQPIDGGRVYDVNSMYPAMMMYKELPVGMPQIFFGEYEYDPEYPLYIQHLRCYFDVKEDHIPCIQIKGHVFFKKNEYITSTQDHYVDLYVTNVDLELIKDHYNLTDVEYVKGYKFRSQTGIFKDYIEKWMEVKSSPDSTAAQVILAKLMLNSLYGKFATNPNVTGKVPYLKENGALAFRKGEESFRDPIYTPMGCFITAYARENVIRTAQKLQHRFIYADTDSIHVAGLEEAEAIADQIHPSKLGYWDHETTFEKAMYLRQKTYFLVTCSKENEKGKLIPALPSEATNRKNKIACAGMNDTIKGKVTFEEFRIGFKSNGSLKPKQVFGGVVLMDQPFEIK